MSIEQLGKPCWILHLTNDDEIHCESEEAAEQWLTPDIAHLRDRIELADQPCFIARCNTCRQPEEGEDGNAAHFDTATPELGDLTTTEGGQHICAWCRDKCPCTGYTTHVLGAPWCACGHQATAHTDNETRCTRPRMTTPQEATA